MKKYIFFLFFFLYLSLNCSQDSIIEEETKTPTDKWSVSGTILIPEIEIKNLKIAAAGWFWEDPNYDDDFLTTTPIISNIAKLDKSNNSFTLSIDTTSIIFTLTEKDYIRLVIWDDDNSNDCYDSLEIKTTPVPTSNCKIWANSSTLKGDFIFFEQSTTTPSKGWYYYCGNSSTKKNLNIVTKEQNKLIGGELIFLNLSIASNFGEKPF